MAANFQRYLFQMIGLKNINIPGGGDNNGNKTTVSGYSDASLTTN